MGRLRRYPAIPWDVLEQAVKGAPRGAFRYSSLEFAQQQLPPAMTDLVLTVAKPCIARQTFGEGGHTTGIRVSYHWGRVMPSQSAFGNSDWHRDGKGHANEWHTLLVWSPDIVNQSVTEFRRVDANSWTVNACEPVTYSGSVEHRMIKVPREHDRLVIRVSSTWMRVRNHWTAWEE